MNIFFLGVELTNEERSRVHFKKQRDKYGVSATAANRPSIVGLLTSGTIMESSKLYFMTWYNNIFLLSTTKNGFSSKEL
jgi:hypothetical protein